MDGRYVILKCEAKTQHAGAGVRRACLYQVYTDDALGMADFVADQDDVLPGSTVDVDDLKTIFRLRMDGNWTAWRYYGTDEGGLEAAEEAAAAAILNEMLPDELVEEETA